jgi:predicted phosphodiesterase
MLVAVVSDIHSNLVALEAVLAASPQAAAVWCLGDTVGYGPRPEACARLVMERGTLSVAGNHDRAVVRELTTEDFNHDARDAADWTATQLSDQARGYLRGLPERESWGDFTLVHGSPREPIWEYLMSARAAEVSFRHFSTACCLVGHTHVPSIFTLSDGKVSARYADPETELELRPEARYILNPGSVGQPRDEDPRAAYLLLDTERRVASWRRVEYDVAATQAQMRAEHLPPALIERLALGL